MVCPFFFFFSFVLRSRRYWQVESKSRGMRGKGAYKTPILHHVTTRHMSAWDGQSCEPYSVSLLWMVEWQDMQCPIGKTGTDQSAGTAWRVCCWFWRGEKVPVPHPVSSHNRTLSSCFHWCTAKPITPIGHEWPLCQGRRIGWWFQISLNVPKVSVRPPAQNVHKLLHWTLRNATLPSAIWLAGQLVRKSAGLGIERLRVRIPAGAVGEFYFPELTFFADSYSVSVPSPCYGSDT